MTTLLTREEAKRYYDWFGAKQDTQGFYEDAAIDALIGLGGFSRARSVLEIGCGTGKLAQRLLSDHLPSDARYLGLELSDTMADLARARIAPWSDRAGVVLTDGSLTLTDHGTGFDRVVCTYVFDLLSEADIATAVEEAHAALRPHGRLCVAGLTHGASGVSRVTSALWTAVHRVNPKLVGGCRPFAVSGFLEASRWSVIARRIVVAATVPSEVVVAEAV